MRTSGRPTKRSQIEEPYLLNTGTRLCDAVLCWDDRNIKIPQMCRSIEDATGVYVSRSVMWDLIQAFKGERSAQEPTQ